MTDGQINDFEISKDLICRCASLPISVIIVGVGNADFGKMVELDGDEGIYDRNGVKCQRDVVQFVPFLKYNGDKDKLRQAVLGELPTQVEQYYRLRGIFPPPPQMSDVDKLVSVPGFGLHEVLNPMVQIHYGGTSAPPAPGFIQQMPGLQAAPPPGFGVAPAPGMMGPAPGEFNYPMQSMIDSLPT